MIELRKIVNDICARDEDLNRLYDKFYFKTDRCNKIQFDGITFYVNEEDIKDMTKIEIRQILSKHLMIFKFLSPFNRMYDCAWIIPKQTVKPLSEKWPTIHDVIYNNKASYWVHCEVLYEKDSLLLFKIQSFNNKCNLLIIDKDSTQQTLAEYHFSNDSHIFNNHNKIDKNKRNEILKEYCERFFETNIKRDNLVELRSVLTLARILGYNITYDAHFRYFLNELHVKINLRKEDNTYSIEALSFKQKTPRNFQLFIFNDKIIKKFKSYRSLSNLLVEFKKTLIEE